MVFDDILHSPSNLFTTPFSWLWKAQQFWRRSCIDASWISPFSYISNVLFMYWIPSFFHAAHHQINRIKRTTIISALAGSSCHTSLKSSIVSKLFFEIFVNLLVAFEWPDRNAFVILCRRVLLIHCAITLFRLYRHDHVVASALLLKLGTMLKRPALNHICHRRCQNHHSLHLHRTFNNLPFSSAQASVFTWMSAW